MLPVATGPNAICYGASSLKTTEMMRTGLLKRRRNMFVRHAQPLWMATPAVLSCIMEILWMVVWDLPHGVPPVWTAAPTT